MVKTDKILKEIDGQRWRTNRQKHRWWSPSKLPSPKASQQPINKKNNIEARSWWNKILIIFNILLNSTPS